MQDEMYNPYYMQNNQDVYVKTDDMQYLSNIEQPPSYIFNDDICDDDANPIRQKFILKVYLILFVQLLLTFSTTLVFIFVKPINIYVQQNNALFITAVVLSFVFLLALLCCEIIAKTFPLNYLVLFCFTAVQSYLVSTASSYYDTDTVLWAVLLTMLAIMALTIFAYYTDFTGAGPYLVVLFVILIFFGFMNIIFCSTKCQIMNTIYSASGAFIFSMFVVYDTQLIIGGNHMRYQFDETDHIFAALILYVDIINLFLYILSLMAECKKKK